MYLAQGSARRMQVNDLVLYCCGKSHVENVGRVGEVEWNVNNTSITTMGWAWTIFILVTENISVFILAQNKTWLLSTVQPLGDRTDTDGLLDHSRVPSPYFCMVENLFYAGDDFVKGEGSFYIAQYPVRRTAQSTVHFCPRWQTCSFPTPTRLLRDAF